MLTEAAAEKRALKTVELAADLVVVGGGLAGTCAAITAARAGIKVVLVQDRPVLGGNASSEVRLWILGATTHMGSNNRWAREGGVVDEILVENMYRNPEGNPLIFDTVLLEKVVEEKNITLLLNTAVYEVEKVKGDADRIAAVVGFCSQNSTKYVLRAPLFLDSSGDGVVGFLAGAAFRMGAESKEEFDEKFAPTGEFGHLLGHSIYFYSKDTGKPVKFTAPSYAIKDVEGKIPRYRQFNAKEFGCRLWWIEWGGRLDTVHETETIKWELWRVVYGVWDYIKNSGKFPEAENLTLEWVGQIPGKRESRRFEGPYMLSQKDVVERRIHADGAAFGGWSIDLHPADGVFSERAGSHHLYSKGIYQIPLRCLFSRNISNLFFAGRIISATHVAFGSTRVMATGGHGGQAVGIAAAHCLKWGCLPGDLLREDRMKAYRLDLLRTGQHLPGVRLEDGEDLAQQAEVRGSSELVIGELASDAPALVLEKDEGQMFVVQKGKVPVVTLRVDADEATTLEVELRTTSRLDHHAPDVVLAKKSVEVTAGTGVEVRLDFGVSVEEERMVLVCVRKNAKVKIARSMRRVTGMISLFHGWDAKNSAVGGDDYEVWQPERRPKGWNWAMKFEPALANWAAKNVMNGFQRPTNGTNCWVPSEKDGKREMTLAWKGEKAIRRVEIFYDTDKDHAMESVLWGQPERAVPFCVRHFRLKDGAGRVVHECTENHQARNVVTFAEALRTDKLVLEIVSWHGAEATPAVFEVRCYA